jgi:hypothetical protein
MPQGAVSVSQLMTNVEIDGLACLQLHTAAHAAAGRAPRRCPRSESDRVPLPLKKSTRGFR